MPVAYVRGLGLLYADGTERMEIWISKKESSSIHHAYGSRVPIKLRIGNKTFDAGIRSTSKNKYVWICPDLRDEQGKKIRLHSRDHQQGLNLPSHLGEFRILSQVGRGGMGVVYEAIQESLGRRVALKVLAGGSGNDRLLLERFKREAQAASQLHHTNIVPVFGIGEAGGVYYYAMQFISGQSLDRLMSNRRSRSSASVHNAPTIALHGSFVSLNRQESPHAQAKLNLSQMWADCTLAGTGGQAKEFYRTVARIGGQAAAALDYAHANGVLHRDIKPANLILDVQGDIWVSDFGLARIDGLDELTVAEDILGTLRYIPPERFKGLSDARGDVYSLGLTLYELLVNQPAFQAATRDELIHHVLHAQPPRLRSLDSRVPRDLETIVLKAIAKDPQQRYQSAAALLEDLRRFQSDRPIRAKPQSTLEASWRWCRKNPIIAALATTAALLVIAVALVSTTAYLRENRLNQSLQLALGRAQTSEVKGRHELFASYVASAKAAQLTRSQGQRLDSSEALKNAVQLVPHMELSADAQQQSLAELRDLAIMSLSLPDIRELGDTAPGATIDTCFFDRTAQRHASDTLVIRRLPENTEIARLSNVSKETHFQFSPQREMMLLVDQAASQLWQWHIGDSQAELVTQLPRQEGQLFDTSFSRNAQRLLLWYTSETNANAQIVDWPSGQLRFARSMPLAAYRAHMSPDGRYLATIDGEYREPASHFVRVIEVDSGKEHALLEHTGPVSSTAWHPDSQTLLVGLTDSNDIVTWNIDSREQTRLDTSQRGGGPKLCINSTGELLTSFSSWANRLDVWRPSSGRAVLHMSGELDVAWSHPDGRMLGEVHRPNGCWHYQTVEPSPVLMTLERSPALGPVVAWRDMSIHHDGRLLAVGSDNGVSLFDLESGLEVGYLPVGYALHPCFVPATGELLTYSQLGLLRWPVVAPTGDEQQWTVGPPQQLPCVTCSGTQVATDRTGHTIAVAAMNAAYVIKDSGQRVMKLGTAPDCRKIAVSPDGRWVVTSSHHSGAMETWSAETGERLNCLIEEGAGAISVCPRFSDDGSFLTTNARHPALFETHAWKKISLTASADAMIARISPDARMLVDLSPPGAILREAATGRKLCRLNVPDSASIWHANFSPDGRRLVLSSNDQHATYVWDLPRLNRELSAIGLGWGDATESPFVNPGPIVASIEPLKVRILE